MRKTNQAFTEEVFLRSKQLQSKSRKEKKIRHGLLASISAVVACVVLCIGVGGLGANTPLGPEVVSAFVYDAGEQYSYTSENSKIIGKLTTFLKELEKEETGFLDGLKEYEGVKSHYFKLTDSKGVTCEYYLYEDRMLVCSDGSRYPLSEEEVDVFMQLIEEDFYQKQSRSLEQYQRLLTSFTAEHTDSTAGAQIYDANYGGAYIDDDGELVVLLVEITEDSIQKVQEAIGSNVLKIEKCEYPYNDLMQVIYTLNHKLSVLSYADIRISEMYEDIYTSRVIIKVPDLTEEKEAVIRSYVDLPCMEISDSASAVVETPLKEEEINQYDTATIAIVEGSVTPTSLTALISYTGKGELMYGQMYYLEGLMDDGKWYRLSDNSSMFESIGYLVLSGQTREEAYDWEWRYETLEKGQYRIVLPYSYQEEENEKRQDGGYLVAEFEIE